MESGPYVQGTLMVFTDGSQDRALHSIDQFCRGLKQQIEDVYKEREAQQEKKGVI